MKILTRRRPANQTPTKEETEGARNLQLMKKKLFGLALAAVAVAFGINAQDNGRCARNAENCANATTCTQASATCENATNCNQANCNQANCNEQQCTQNAQQCRAQAACRGANGVRPNRPNRPNLFEGIDLSAEQRATLDTLQRTLKNKTREAQTDSVRRSLRAEYLQNVKVVLTAEQYTQFLENAFVNAPERNGQGRLGRQNNNGIRNDRGVEPRRGRGEGHRGGNLENQRRGGDRPAAGGRR